MEAFGNPQDRLPSFHIAGTNGKGSTAAFLAAMLISDGYRVAQFASPHLTNVTERCIINGRPIAEKLFSDAIDQVVDIAESLGIPLTYFELTTAASFVATLGLGVDYLVVEVGLGGRLDATNVLSKPLACAITSISYDHTNVLGETLPDIAYEKAGIIKQGSPVYVGRVDNKVAQVIADVAASKHTSCYFLGIDYNYCAETKTFSIADKEISLRLTSPHLLGVHQVENASIAAALASKANLTSSAIEAGIASARWPGRLEQIKWHEISILLDAAHNLDGMRTLVDFLKLQGMPIEGRNRLVVISSFLETKDWHSMVELLVTSLSRLVAASAVCSAAENSQPALEFWFTKSSHTQAADPEMVANYCIHCLKSNLFQAKVSTFATPNDAIRALSEIPEPDKTITVIAGSIYLLGDIYPLLGVMGFVTCDNGRM